MWRCSGIKSNLRMVMLCLLSLLVNSTKGLVIVHWLKEGWCVHESLILTQFNMAMSRHTKNYQEPEQKDFLLLDFMPSLPLVSTTLALHS